GTLPAEHFDIERAATGNMGDAFTQLRGATASVGTADINIVLLGRGERRSTRWALGWHHEFSFRTVAQLRHRTQNLWDHIAGFAQHHHVSDQDALAGDLLAVMQGGHFDRRAGHTDRLHDARGRQSPGSAHTDPDIEHRWSDFFDREAPGHTAAPR